MFSIEILIGLAIGLILGSLLERWSHRWTERLFISFGQPIHPRELPPVVRAEVQDLDRWTRYRAPKDTVVHRSSRP